MYDISFFLRGKFIIFSRWVVYHTRKTLLILYLQTHITRHFLCQNHKIIVYFYLQFSITHAHYAWLISLTFIEVACEYFAQLLVSVSNFYLYSFLRYISGTHKWWNWKNNKDFVCLNRILDRFIGWILSKFSKVAI